MRCLLFVMGLLVSGLSSAHHSTAANFTREIITVDGVIEKVRYQNPHASILIRNTDENGNKTYWLIETEARTTLQRRGVTLERLAVGTHITASGRKGRRQYTMFLKKIILEDGSGFTLDSPNK